MAVETLFNRNFDPPYAKIEQVAPMIRRVVARNPGPFGFRGTATFILGEGKVAMIDPGPLIDEHVETLKTCIPGEEVSHILVTHTHNDHSPAAAPLKKWCGAPTYGFGPHGSGRFEQGIEVEEGGDHDFEPDFQVRDGDVLEGDGWSVECVHTPGHTSNHICYHLQEAKAFFPGDHVMGWSTTIVSPPDGDMADYMASLQKLLTRDDGVYWPTHGPSIEEPRAYITALCTHREERENQVLDCLVRGIDQIADMVPQIYQGLDPKLLTAAARSVFSHVIKLIDEGRIFTEGKPAVDARYKINRGVG